MNKQLGKAVNGSLPTGAEVVRMTRSFQENAMLSFSLGKDSVATWIAIHGKFKRIVPYYLYGIPGLSFIEKAIKYYEWKFGTKIYQYPHPSFARKMNAELFQSPANLQVIAAAGLYEGDYMDINRMCCEDAKLDPSTYVATGVRAADSPIRRVAFTKHGVISHTRKIFYPVWDWTKQDVIDACVTNNVGLPEDYKVFGRSFDGIDLRFLLPIREHYPKDYQRILSYFPFADMEIARYEFAVKRGYVARTRKGS